MVERMRQIIRRRIGRNQPTPHTRLTKPISFPGRCELSPENEVTGSVEKWNSEEGWGILVSPTIEGTVFAHFSVLDLCQV